MKTLLIISCAAILTVGASIGSFSEAAQGDAAETGFDTPARVGQSALPGSAAAPSGSSHAGTARAVNFPPAQINTPKPGPADLPVQADPRKPETASSGLTGILSVLIPTQEDLDKAFQSQLGVSGRARKAGSGTKSDKGENPR
jgi:hypothetical protein